MAPTGDGQTFALSPEACVTIPQNAEKPGYEQIRSAEHHNSEVI